MRLDKCGREMVMFWRKLDMSWRKLDIFWRKLFRRELDIYVERTGYVCKQTF